MKNLITLLATSIFTLSTASAATEKNVEILFSFPTNAMFGGAKADRTLDDAIIDHLNRATRGSTVKTSLYQAADMKVADAFVRAYQRGVNLKMVLDDSVARDDASRPFFNKIKSSLRSDAYHVCEQGACVGSANNHNKFYVFSEVVDAKDSRKVIRNVVLSSSANLTDNQKKKHNNMVIVREDEALFKLFSRHADNLFNERKDPDYLHSMDGHGAGSGQVSVTAYFYPAQAMSDEPLLETLRATSCEQGGEIRMVHSLFKEQYAYDVMLEMVRLQKSGCNVGLILRNNADDNQWIRELKKYKLKVTYKDNVGIHSKYLTIDALVKDDRTGQKTRKQIVFTGSANMKSQSVYENDETTLKIENSNIYKIYFDNWSKISKQ